MQSTSTRYKLSLLALSPLVLAYVIYRAFKDGGIRYFLQRLGFGYKNSEPGSIHFHCASVGEYITAKPLILAFLAENPDNKIVITTNTPTAAKLVAKDADENLTHCYFPVDFSFSVKRFLKHIQPRTSFILETEIWPTYYTLAKQYKIPVSIINARLSEKTLQANHFIKKEYSCALSSAVKILARSKQDHKKFISLGANPKTTSIIGNLKYSTYNYKHNQLACTTIKRPFFLAASTHENEEFLLSQHIELLKRKDFLLVLAPRYPERCETLSQQLKQNGFNIAIRSQHDAINNDTDIYIIDTLGELDIFFNEAALVFVGGSLIPRGGHNILEPASFGKCTIVGPHTDNFDIEIKELLEVNAIIQVKDNHELGMQLITLLKNDLQREKYGINAMNFVEQQSAVLSNYLNEVKMIIDKS